MKLEQLQKNNLAITQQLIQNIEVLQMTGQELVDYIYAEAMENPTIDIDNIHISEMRKRIEWIRKNEHGVQGRYTVTDEDKPVADRPRKNTLKEHLLSQLSGLRLSDDEKKISQYLISCVEPKGYLNEDVDRVAELLDVPAELVTKCMDRLRTMDPPGVCAQNLGQCLLAQLPKDDNEDICRQIISNHLDSLAKGHYSSISKSLGVSMSSVKKALETIQSLSPIPASGFDSGEETYYYFPDAYVTVKDGEPEISLYRSYVPLMKINDYYYDLYSTTEDSSVKSYLDKKLKSADWLIKCVSQREQTLSECLRIIGEIQRDYFVNGSAIKSMTISDVAERMGVHNSTVSRAIRGKAIQCAKGVVPIKNFFSKRIISESEESSSTDYAKRLIQAFVDEEDSSNPLSDQQLCEKLKAKGCLISRRTIAKYRNELGIPSTLIRKTK